MSKRVNITDETVDIAFLPRKETTTKVGEKTGTDFTEKLQFYFKRQIENWQYVFQIKTALPLQMDIKKTKPHVYACGRSLKRKTMGGKMGVYFKEI
jgi:hypothetical protein